jgi:hypothetical protein
VWGHFRCVLDNFESRSLFDGLKVRRQADENKYVPYDRQGPMLMRKTRRISLLLVMAALAVVCAAGVPAAYAQDSLDDPSAAQYEPNIPPGDDTASSSASGGGGLDSNIGSLPFTGMDLLIVAGVALVLTGTGFALRRLSTPPGPRV